jgi:hypothetical protein
VLFRVKPSFSNEGADGTESPKMELSSVESDRAKTSFPRSCVFPTVYCEASEGIPPDVEVEAAESS